MKKSARLLTARLSTSCSELSRQIISDVTAGNNLICHQHGIGIGGPLLYFALVNFDEIQDFPLSNWMAWHGFAFAIRPFFSIDKLREGTRQVTTNVSRDDDYLG